jgi:hypothetical protein
VNIAVVAIADANILVGQNFGMLVFSRRDVDYKAGGHSGSFETCSLH